MNFLKEISLTLLKLTKQVWALPQTIRSLLQQRQQQAARNELEVERLDRIRNPSKYRGK